ncbi:MAG TPA: sulfotransferase [Rhizomicrobium sp.]|nr:sulfotransferase [Rhizomicrobium sp.]
MPFSPIFIVGVPRSGTTLLRVLLDSHSQILALPETPWVCGAYGGPLSLRQLLLDLAEGPYGAVCNVAGVDRGHVLQAGAAFLEHLLAPALAARGKKTVAFKTPSDIPHLEFLTALLPQARYIHITRDGRDVALSQLSKKGSFFLELRGYRRLSFFNLLRRWTEWEQKARSVLAQDKLHVLHLRYENLISDPEREMRRIMVFLDMAFEPGMLDYAAKSHDYPQWEAGSSDVVQRRGLSDASVGKWRKGRKSIEVLHALARYDHALVQFGYPSSALNPKVGERLLIAGYAIVQPVLEILSLAARRIRPLVRNRDRAAACFGLLFLGLYFLAQAAFPAVVPATVRPLLCFGATLGVAWAFAPLLLRRGSPAIALLRTGFLMLSYVLLLGAGQTLVLGRPAMTALLFDLIGVFAALIAATGFVFKVRPAAPMA